MNKKILFLGGLAYLLLAALALWFYKERTAFVDLAFHLFYIIKDGTVTIQNNRFGSVFTQVFPLVSSKLGLPLKAVMQIYSLGFILLYFSIFATCVGFLRKWKFGLTLLLFNTLMVTQTFYWTQSEFPQGLAFMVLYFAILAKASESDIATKIWYTPATTFLIVMLAFFHPLLIFPFFFASAYFFYFKHIKRDLLIKSGITYFIFYLVKKFLFVTSYDNRSMGGLKNFSSLFPDYFTMQSNKNFLQYLITDYYLLIPVLLLILFYFIKEKHYIPLFLTLTSFFGYLLLINVSFYQGAEHFYIENLYLPLSLFLIIPLVFDILPRFKQKHFLIGLTVVLLIRIGHIYSNHKPYSQRISYLQNILKETSSLKNKKLVYHDNKFSKDTLMMTWGTPYEFWLLSTIETGESRSIMISPDPSQVKWALDKNKSFITAWGVFNYNKLPSKYFIFKDNLHYQIIE